jgi:hypothetical protein
MDKVLLAVASTLETLTGAVLIVASTMIKLLSGTNIFGATLAIVRVAGFGLLFLGVACWPRGEAIVPRLKAMLIYNVLTTFYLGYVRFASESLGILLLPVIVVHAC